MEQLDLRLYAIRLIETDKLIKVMENVDVTYFRYGGCDSCGEMYIPVTVYEDISGDDPVRLNLCEHCWNSALIGLKSDRNSHVYNDTLNLDLVREYLRVYNEEYYNKRFVVLEVTAVANITGTKCTLGDIIQYPLDDKLKDIKVVGIAGDNITFVKPPQNSLVSIPEGANIEVKHEGVLEVPEGKSVTDLGVQHFVSLAEKKGYAEVVRALTNLQVWNKKSNPSLSSWASNMKKQLKEKMGKE